MGLAAAKAELARKEREYLELQAERELVDRNNEIRATRAMGNTSPMQWKDPKAGSSTKKAGKEESVDLEILNLRSLQKRVMDNVEIVTMVATKSSNLKGGYVLKDAARSITAVIETIASRPQKQEQERLEKINESLIRSNSELKAELETLRNEVCGMREALKELRGVEKPRRQPLPPSQPQYNMEVSDEEGEKPSPLQFKKEEGTDNGGCIGSAIGVGCIASRGYRGQGRPQNTGPNG